MESGSVLALPSGWLYKWTNYIKGYRRRCHPNAVSHTCMGTIDLTNVTIYSKNSATSFILREARGRSYHLKALNEQDKKRWLDTLASAKSKLVASRNGLESDSLNSDDLNSYVTSRRSVNNGKITQSTASNSATSSWRSFGRFRRRPHKTVVSSPSAEEAASAEVTTPLSMPRSSAERALEIRKSDRKPGIQSPLTNGSNFSELTSLKSTNDRTSGPSFSLSNAYSPHRRHCTLNAGLNSELRVTREVQQRLNDVDAAFDNFVIQANHAIESINAITTNLDKHKTSVPVPITKLTNLQSTIETLVETCQRTMAAWAISTEWFQRKLAAEYDKSARLELTVEQLAKQHRALETQFYSSYASLSSNTNQPNSPFPPINIRVPASASFQRDTARTAALGGVRSLSSMDDVFFDAESTFSSYQSRGGLKGGEDGEGSDAIPLQPSFASIGSLSNVDESSGSEEDDMVTAAADEGIFAVPGNRYILSTSIAGRTPSNMPGPPFCSEDHIHDCRPQKTTFSSIRSPPSWLVRSPPISLSASLDINLCCSGSCSSPPYFTLTSYFSSSLQAQMNGGGYPRGSQFDDFSERKEDTNSSPQKSAITPRRQRRTSIPPRPRISLNLWAILKNCIGRELTKIPLPVNFNEPLSFLQRVVEDLTYSRCLDEAAQVPISDPVSRLAWIAAFSVSSYATTAVRMTKPFNPLLGETYECDRSDDFGWRSFSEQVSHHPPVLSHYCESIRYGWKFWQEFTVSSKFRGKYLSLIPKGCTHLVFKDGHHFTWSKVTISVHNIIVGRLWPDLHGETVIKNHTTNYACHMKYTPHSYFSNAPDRQVTGLITDPSGKLVYKVTGKWDSQMEGCHVDPEGNPTEPSKVLLVLEPLPPNAESMYNFNKFTVELNEPEDGVAPTDSRFRPDQRLMELGRWDEANVEKERLEVKQRRKRRAWDLYESGEPLDPKYGLPYTPIWFSPVHDTYTDIDYHEFNGTYWTAKAKQDWSKCPDIY
ncbi:hypothetical protein Aperf_G00000036391 [Anoplocephala perfoliata]